MRVLIPLLFVSSALAASPFEEQHMEDSCFYHIVPVFSDGGKVAGVETANGLENNRAQYIVTFKIAGPLPHWYRVRTVSCYFDKSTRRYLSDDIINKHHHAEKIQEERKKDSQEVFKVNRYNSRLRFF
jgi:hypothetical protein